MKGIKKIIAADKLRRQRERDEQADRLHTAYADGVRRGREQRHPPVTVPVDLAREVTGRLADYMARDLWEQNSERSAEVMHILADIATAALKRCPWNYRDAKQLAEYVVDDRNVRFNFEVSNLRAGYQMPRVDMISGGK